ncbi:MAG: hypothetical protein N2V76_10605 [Methanophagales archaeon]|nr:hypothetical protein [Methanophagales archaeon]
MKILRKCSIECGKNILMRDPSWQRYLGKDVGTMIRQRFREERSSSSLGIVLRPVAEVILKKDGFAVEIPMYVDTLGAIINF